MKSIKQDAEQLMEVLVGDRRALHAWPEVGFALPKTTAYVIKRLKEMGYEPQEISESAVVATVGRPGKTFLLRADMDALPTCETADVPFRSQNEYGHLCGHDMHTAMLLGAAHLLKQHEAELPGTVKLMFQPNEEGGRGAKAMVEAGVMAGVDAALALHVNPLAKAGEITCTKGVASACMDSFYIQVQGKGAHGSTPHLAVDPLHIVTAIYTALNGLIGKEVDPQQAAVLTIGKLGGGTAVNVIPDTAEICGAVRCYDPDVRNHLVKRIYEIIEQTTTMMRGSYTVTKSVATPSVVNDGALCDLLAPFMAEIVAPEPFHFVTKPLSGTEDFSYVSQQVPSMYAFLGAGGPDGYPGHNPNVVFDEAALPLGAAVLANCAAQWLMQQPK